MAKKSMVARDVKRRRLADQYAERRAELKATVRDLKLPAEERMKAQMKLSALPRNSAPTRIRNRCQITGRPRGFYRKLKISRVALRRMASNGAIPGMVKSSW